MAQKGVYSGGMGRFWEGRISKGREYILGGRGTFWEGGIDSGSVTYSYRKGGWIMEWRGRLWECRIELPNKGVSILGGRSRLWEGRIWMFRGGSILIEGG